ncbi:hypothetical protein D3C81_2187720 [compost metagenome]
MQFAEVIQRVLRRLRQLGRRKISMADGEHPRQQPVMSAIGAMHKTQRPQGVKATTHRGARNAGNLADLGNRHLRILRLEGLQHL